MKGQIPQQTYRITVDQILGDCYWYVKRLTHEGNYTAAPLYSGYVDGEAVHTERLEEVLSYIANEIGSTDPAA